MNIDQVFFHLTYAFLLVSALAKLPPFARFMQVLVVLSLGSFLTMTDKSEIVWQVWSSSIVLFHLFFWKNYKSNKSKYEDLEIEIWNEFFVDTDDEDFQLLLDCSEWKKFSFSATITLDKDYFILTTGEDEHTWLSASVGTTHSVQRDDLKLFVDREELREANALLETAILHILTRSSQKLAS